MTRFLQQLIARQHGQAETVQPLLASRFEQSAALNVGETFFPASPAEEMPTHPIVTTVPTHPSSPQQAPSPHSVTPPITPPIPSTPLNREPATKPPITNSIETITRLETITHWTQPSPTTDPIHPSVAEPITPAASLPQQAKAAASEQFTHPEPIFLQETPPANTAQTVDQTPRSSFDAAQPSPTPATFREGQIPTTPLSHPLLPLSPSPSLPSPPSPTIQIAIGRIEIRGTVPSPPPSPTPRPTRSRPKPAVSLDAYLQQRSRRT